MTDLLIDGPSIYARSYYAAAKPEPIVKDVFKFGLTTIIRLLDPASDKLNRRIDRMLIAWDGEHSRDKGRTAKPAIYHETRKLFKDALSVLFDCRHVSSAQFEADDIVATAAAQSNADQAIVVSGDKDLQQLHGGKIQYYCLNEKSLLSARAIVGKWGIKRPSQIAIALAVIGDKSDNIKGIKGWGPVKVAKLFAKVDEKMLFDEALQTVVSTFALPLGKTGFRPIAITLLQSPDRHKDVETILKYLFTPAVPNVPVTFSVRFGVSVGADTMNVLTADAGVTTFGNIPQMALTVYEIRNN